MAVHFTNRRHSRDSDSQALRCDVTIHEMLVEIMAFYVSNCGFRDKFFFEVDIPLKPWGQFSLFRSTRTDCEFEFGFDCQGFFLETFIRHPEHLKRMDDEFWVTFTSLSSLGKLLFTRNASLSSAEGLRAAKRFKAQSSNVFTLIRNAVLFEIFEPAELKDLGSLKLSWSVETPWESILANGLDSFQKMYKMNYLLYRAEYLKSRRSTFSGTLNSQERAAP